MKNIERLIAKRMRENAFRTLPSVRYANDFCSNDYLGLSKLPTLQETVSESYRRQLSENPTSATGSRLISGNYSFYATLEPMLAEYFSGESALVFHSGYAANLGVLSCVAQRGDTILYDELCHASIKDGIRLSLANRFPFLHNNLTDLERKLKRAIGEKFIVVESVYSMDGDLAPLNEIVQIAKKYHAYIVVDEAHGTGVFGRSGEGLCVELGLHNDIDIRIYTFGKAVGCHGACVVSNDSIRNYLINFSRPFIYSTGLPLHALVTIYEHILYMKTHQNLQRALRLNIKYFKTITKDNPDFAPSDSAIQVLKPGSVSKVNHLAKSATEKGFGIKAILSPTVKPGSERIRICLHSFNSESSMEALLQVLLNA